MSTDLSIIMIMLLIKGFESLQNLTSGQVVVSSTSPAEAGGRPSSTHLVSNEPNGKLLG